MPVNNIWVGYLDRSYEQIKASVLHRLGISNPEITDYSESNTLIIIISLFSGIAEMLGYYIDNIAREAFIDTARRFTSMVRLIRILDYRIKTRFSAGVDITFEFKDVTNVLIPTTAASTIPAGTIISSSTGMEFRTLELTNIPAGTTSIKIPCAQFQILSNVPVGTTNGVAGQIVTMGLNLVHNSTSLIINGQVWTEQNTFAFSNPTSKHFIIDILTDGVAYIIFGDGVFGAIPLAGFTIFASFRTCEGSAGNLLTPNSITTLVTALSLPGITNITVTNEFSPNGGSNYEAFELLRFRAPLWVRTLERAVSYSDYRDVALLHPSVEHAAVDFCCTYDCIKVYIGPVGGGIASIATINAVQDWMDCRKIITTKVCVRPAAITHIKIEIEAVANFRQDPILMSQDILAALLEYGSYDNSDINRAIRYSDITALVDNLFRVDYMNIIRLYTEPYARPENSVTELNWTRLTLATSNTHTHWKLEYNLGNIRIFREGVYLGQIPIGTLWTDPNGSVSFTVLSGPYSNGMYWTFVSYPTDVDLEIDDFTVPIIDQPDIIINGLEATNILCKPNCSHTH